ncbi:MAG TPA: anti-sigma factor [Ktedonobacteraceae bacterium]
MICQDIEELSGAYVLDAVTPQERQEVEEHLVACPDCTQLVQELQSVAELLPLSVPPVEPSPSLQARVLTRIQADADQSIQWNRPRRNRRWRNWTNPLIAVAAILVLALLGSMTAWNISLQRQLNTQTYITYAVKGTTAIPGASGQLLYIPSKNITILTVQGLPQAQGNQVYQGWLLRGNQPVSIGVLNIHNGVASESFQGNVQGYDTTAVSLEPGPGASQDAPKGQIVATGKLNSSTLTGYGVV